MADYSELKALALQVRNNTAPGSNTAVLVGGVLVSLVTLLEELEEHGGGGGGGVDYNEVRRLIGEAISALTTQIEGGDIKAGEALAADKLSAICKFRVYDYLTDWGGNFTDFDGSQQYVRLSMPNTFNLKQLIFRDSGETRSAAVEIDENGNFIFHGGVVAKGDVVAYAADDTQIMTIAEAMADAVSEVNSAGQGEKAAIAAQAESVKQDVAAAGSSAVTSVNSASATAQSTITSLKNDAVATITGLLPAYGWGTTANNQNGKYVLLFSFTVPSYTYCQYSGKFGLEMSYSDNDIIHVSWGWRVNSSPSISTLIADVRGNQERTNKIAFSLSGTTLRCYVRIDGTDYALATFRPDGYIRRQQGTGTGVDYPFTSVSSGGVSTTSSLPGSIKYFSVKS